MFGKWCTKASKKMLARSVRNRVMPGMEHQIAEPGGAYRRSLGRWQPSGSHQLANRLGGGTGIRADTEPHHRAADGSVMDDLGQCGHVSPAPWRRLPACHRRELKQRTGFWKGRQ